MIRMLRCPRCGNAISPGKSFCADCGLPIGQQATAASPSPAPHQAAAALPAQPAPPSFAGIPLSPVIVIGVIVVLLLLAGFVLFMYPQDSGSGGGTTVSGSSGVSETSPPDTVTGTAPANTATTAETPLPGTPAPGVCPAGTTACQGTCRDLRSDEQNCGACGAACPQGGICRSGQCTLACPSGFSDCRGSCRDISTDESNCGSCGNTCRSDQVCRNGACSAVSQYYYPAATIPVTPPPTTAAVTYPPATQASPGCNPGLTLCYGSCVNLLTDKGNCGSCTHRCLINEKCVGGSCVLSYCEKPLTMCSGTCKNLYTDMHNCGSCGKYCPAGCINGACVPIK